MLGIEITPGTVRAAAFSGTGVNRKILSSASVQLPEGVVSETYSFPHINDRAALLNALRGCLPADSRAGLCLPDAVFRVVTLEFDQFPPKPADQERLVRWRLEKTAAFDLSDTLLRYQILRRQDTGFTILVSACKKSLIEQYESLLLELGIEPWFMGPASFSALNFYAGIAKGSSAHALIHTTESSVCTIVFDQRGARFYRFKDVKKGSVRELCSRFVREIEDSLHFYIHADRSQRTELGRVYVSGERAVADMMSGELKNALSLDVQALSPGVVLPSASGADPAFAPALGAGCLV